MLIANKFIYLPVPRCASTSFLLSCLKYNLDIQVKYLDDIPKISYNDLKYRNASDEEIIQNFIHAHIDMDYLLKKFGDKYTMISVNRNRHERFVSLWRHILIELNNDIFYTSAYDILKNLTTDDILFYSKFDVPNFFNLKTLFIERFNLIEKNTGDLDFIIHLFCPVSFYYQFYKNIIWFDFDKLYELEEWVSNKLNMEFKLEKINSSDNIDCNLKLDDHFIEKYNEIYDSYDFPKTKKTLL